MAFTFTNKDSGGNSNNASTYATNSIAPTASRLLIAGFVVGGTVLATPTCSGNSLTWVLQNASIGSTHSHYVFTALTGSSPTTGAVTIDVTGDAGTGVVWDVVEVDGGDLTTPVTQVAGNSGGTAATPDATFASATASGCAIFGFLQNNTNPSGVTQPTGFTLDVDTGNASAPTLGGEGVYHASPGSVTTVTWGSLSATIWRTTTLELAAAAGGGGGTTVMQLGLLGVG